MEKPSLRSEVGLPNQEKENHEEIVAQIYRDALIQHPDLAKVDSQELHTLISQCLEEIKRLEKASDPKTVAENLTPEIAKNITALWDFSGPDGHGLYHGIDWSVSLDQDRLNYTAWLERKISEQLSSAEAPRGGINSVTTRQTQARALILQNGPTIIYNGSNTQNDRVRDMLDEPTIVPKEKVFIEGEGYKTTIDQIKNFKFPPELKKEGKEIGLISNAPHLMRIAHILGRYDSVLPSDMVLRFFPIKSPISGRNKYAEMEIKGLIYYIYISKDRDASKEPHPYIIHGEK